MKLDNIVAISGLLLTLITFLFNLAWPKISAALAQDEAIAGDKARERAAKSVCSVLWLIVFPIFISFLLLFYINLPTAVRIISNSRLSLWNFNVDSTLYVFVVLALLVFVLYNLWLIVKLIRKQTKLK
ncbi:hypothetical protein [Morganella psychrotolerans]|uniref:hypothetical protein n=1 Tax=Morganella psychrotolerans TaxID=368603 RepID=UPI0039B06026